ncbi:MAG: ComF family protein [Sideroxydans sp.]|nr:ComF family protein [Sideroxydans sp.]
MSILSRKILNISAKLEQLLPAQPCLLCGAYSRHRGWCAACDAGLPYLDSAHCPVCALPTPNGAICGRCLQHPPRFSHTVAAFTYAFPLDKLVHALKYGEQLALAESLAERLVQRIEQRPECILPMPLHPARLRERGFNQSQELARRIARKLDVPLLADSVHRIRDTTPQSALPWKQRKRNMRNAFSCSENLDGLHIGIVDDVMTSGATLDELARILRRAGAREVSAWVVARTLPHTSR